MDVFLHKIFLVGLPFLAGASLGLLSQAAEGITPMGGGMDWIGPTVTAVVTLITALGVRNFWDQRKLRLEQEGRREDSVTSFAQKRFDETMRDCKVKTEDLVRQVEQLQRRLEETLVEMARYKAQVELLQQLRNDDRDRVSVLEETVKNFQSENKIMRDELNRRGGFSK